MYKKKVAIGVAPTKRSFLSMEEAVRQKEKFMAQIRTIAPQCLSLIHILCLMPARWK